MYLFLQYGQTALHLALGNISKFIFIIMIVKTQVKKIIEIATVLARHGAGVQEDKVNQNECPIMYSLHNLSKLFYRMEGLFYTWQQKTWHVIQKWLNF